MNALQPFIVNDCSIDTKPTSDKVEYINIITVVERIYSKQEEEDSQFFPCRSVVFIYDPVI